MPPRSVFPRLFLMMILQFAIWGAWLPLIFGYLPTLGFAVWQQGMILNAFPVSALIGMFFSNQFADRNFAAERFLGFSHLVGGLAILGLSMVTSFWPFFLLMLVHCLLYVPTISISHAIAFANMKDAPREFGLVRMGGTIGWILAAWPITFFLIDWDAVQAAHPVGFLAWVKTVLAHPLEGEAMQAGTRWTYVVAGVCSLALAAFSLALPHTPPRPTSGTGEKLAWLEALRFLRQPYILVLWLVTFIDAFVHNCYFNWAGTFLRSAQVGIAGIWTMPIMSIGQVAEILTMFILGATLKKLGWRITLIVGIFGHVLRFLVFAFLPEHTSLVVLVNLLHGICYAFFFATVYIFVDAYFPKDARASAQGLFNVMILGIGAMVANFLGRYLIVDVFTAPDGTVDFRSLFLIPAAIGTLGALMLAFFFHPPKDVSAESTGESAPAH